MKTQILPSVPRRLCARAMRCGQVAVLSLVLLILAAPTMLALSAPVAPESAWLSPSGGTLLVRQELPVIKRDGMSLVRVTLPAGAENFSIEVPSQSVARWHDIPMPADMVAEDSSLREQMIEEIQKVEAKLASAKARLELLVESRPANGTFEDMQRQEKRMAEAVPSLHIECADLELILERLRKELKNLPPQPGPGRLVEVTLLGTVQATSLPVSYRYTFKDCGWRPRYVLDARLDGAKGDAVTMRFLAEMWQHSGLDWRQTKITLVSGGGGPRVPERLPRWVVEAEERSRSMNRAMVNADMAAEAPMMAKAPAEGAASPVERADISAAFASWTLAAKGLPEGRSRMLVLEETWKTPLQWLARPGRGDSRVWLTAHCVLPKERVWPSGMAEFRLDGQDVGSGRFSPRGGEVDLFFGPDPRVQVQATEDARKRGEEGLFNKTRKWSWAWTYVVHNTRDRSVRVRLERPMPQTVDASISVTLADVPEAQKDEREHKLFWDVQVPAGGQAEVHHALTIAAPKDLPVSPHAP